ncbi:MAG: 2-aminoethylphosphonate--pyruvate transaminase [Desulfamplus sp.]|nr:2-aminoethylphosphonate--pyruvate transaminase [Desulfamplus sp.]MBF0243185.1 2-aminoethylphosphonate--pyruvate transaminase [Desulfamplus sp.]
MPDNPYTLLTPGPLSTSKSVKCAMLQDFCTWDHDYNNLVQDIRNKLTKIATSNSIENYTTILMQGSGTFSVESVISTAIPKNGKLLVLTNGAYGERVASIARCHKIDVAVNDSGELEPPDVSLLIDSLESDPAITHVAVVHCETTTGMLNPIEKIGDVVKNYGKIYIVDAMSSFGGIPLDIANVQADYLISSANKCIQGVPGFGFIIAKKSAIESTQGQARTLSLDMYEQWQEMESKNGKWRFTSPTHTVHAFAQALKELEDEGGVEKRYERYQDNHRTLVHGMRELGFTTLLPDTLQSPIITSFLSPDGDYQFKKFYNDLKTKGFVIYPGKVTVRDTFRIGNIGDIDSNDILHLLDAVKESLK